MDTFLELSLLYEYYGELLTDTQKEICDLYYNQNFTLTEIAEDMGITKQGVRDALKKSEKLLYKYEQALSIWKKNDKLGCLVKEIVEKIQKSSVDETEKKQIMDVANQISELI